jgi:peptidoglycan/LPS O-acetylase OafA/YrhL
MIKRLLLLSGIGIAFVVVSHAISRGQTGLVMAMADYTLEQESAWRPLLASPTYLALFIPWRLVQVGMPIFLFISGFFAAYTARESGTTMGRALGTRLFYLLVPYLCWSLVVFGLEIQAGTVRTPAKYLQALLRGDALNPFYYVPLLCQLYLLSPLLIGWARRRPRLLLGVALLLFLGTRLIHYMLFLHVPMPGLYKLAVLNAVWFFPRHLLFFVPGLLLGLYLMPIKRWLAQNRQRLAQATLLLGGLAIVEYYLLLHHLDRPWVGWFVPVSEGFYAVTFILTFLAWDRLTIPFSHSLNVLGRHAYGIYLTHVFFLNGGAYLGYHSIPWLLDQPLIFQALLYVVGLGLPVLLMALVARSPARLVYRYLFG